MKRTFALLLALILLAVSMPTASAARTEGQEAAMELYNLGLFRGTGTDANGGPKFELEREPNRYEAVTMLVRLLGKENEATQKSWDLPFTDVEAWAKPYIGYAYANGLTNGVSATKFSGNEIASASQYLTLVLRALGYASGTDFQWDQAWEKTDALGITDGRYKAGSAFTRGDAAIVSRDALSAKLKGSDKTLRASLEESGAIAAPVDPPKPTPTPEPNLSNYVINDFHRVRNQYSTARATIGYAQEFTDANGDQCVLSIVYYKIKSTFSEVTLHNLSQDNYIKDPVDYYGKMARRAYGSARMKYLKLQEDVLTVQQEMLKAMLEILKTGQHTGKGIYVPPETLNI